MLFRSGYFIKNYTSIFYIQSEKTNNIIFFVSVMILLLLIFIGKPFYVGRNEFHASFIQTFIFSNAAIISLLFVCKKINKISFLDYMGKYSIVTFGVHVPVLRIFKSILKDNIQIVWLSEVLLFVISITCCAIITKYLIKYMPAFIAQKNLINIDFSNKTIKSTEISDRKSVV